MNSYLPYRISNESSTNEYYVTDHHSTHVLPNHRIPSGRSNEQHWFVATQDYALRKELGKVGAGG